MLSVGLVENVDPQMPPERLPRRQLPLFRAKTSLPLHWPGEGGQIGRKPPEKGGFCETRFFMLYQALIVAEMSRFELWLTVGWDYGACEEK